MAIAHAGKVRLEACTDVQGAIRCQEELAVFAAMRVNQKGDVFLQGIVCTFFLNRQNILGG